MKIMQFLMIVACMVTFSLSVSAQGNKKVKAVSPEKWTKSNVWNEGLKAKPHVVTNLAEFKAQYEANPEQWKAAFRWLATNDLTGMEKGRYPIEGTTLVVSVEDGVNGALEKRGSESHRKHIDLQYVVKGTERFALLDHETSKPKNEYNEKADVINYNYDPSKAKFIDSVPGQFFLFFPEDWHIAKIATDKEDQNIRVVVIKLDYKQL